MKILGSALGVIMSICHQFVNNYGLAIIIFVVITKVLLFPISLWVHVNGIRMIRIQPEINRLKVKYFGDKEKISDEQSLLYKKEKYNPFSGILPIFVQLLLLIGLIQVIYHPLSYVEQLSAELVEQIIQITQTSSSIALSPSSGELIALDYIHQFPELFSGITGMTQEIMQSLQDMNMVFLGINLSGIPATDGGWLLLVPFFAGLSAVTLSLSQNVLNPLQAEQGKVGQALTMSFSVGLSLVLGLLIPVGIGIYWIFSNLFTIVQQIVLNTVYKPSRHIDYGALEASKEELARYQKIGNRNNANQKAFSKREKADYKRFFSITNKHLVFYSEHNGYYKYFDRIIRYLLDHSNLTIHYITSDPHDQIFSLSKTESKIKSYYIGEKKLITLLMKLEADVVVMTMTDLNNYHFKRSYIRKDIEYVYIFHYPLSTHMTLTNGALNHYDTILCVGDFQFAEIRKTEEIYKLPPKKLVACGYGQLEKLYDAYHEMPPITKSRPKVLIAPSWQENCILDSCVHELLSALLGQGFDVVVRPHPEYVKRYGIRMDAIVSQYAGYQGDDLTFELDFTSNASLFDSDVVITDWSGAAYEFSFVTERPSVFVDTPPKMQNTEYASLGIEAKEIVLRDQVGIRVDPQNMADLADRIRALLDDGSYKEAILRIRQGCFANFGYSGQVGAEYLLHTIQEKIKQRNEADHA